MLLFMYVVSLLFAIRLKASKIAVMLEFLCFVKYFLAKIPT